MGLDKLTFSMHSRPSLPLLRQEKDIALVGKVDEKRLKDFKKFINGLDKVITLARKVRDNYEKYLLSEEKLHEDRVRDLCANNFILTYEKPLNKPVLTSDEELFLTDRLDLQDSIAELKKTVDKQFTEDLIETLSQGWLKMNSDRVNENSFQIFSTDQTIRITLNPKVKKNIADFKTLVNLLYSYLSRIGELSGELSKEEEINFAANSGDKKKGIYEMCVRLENLTPPNGLGIDCNLARSIIDALGLLCQHL